MLLLLQSVILLVGISSGQSVTVYVSSPSSPCREGEEPCHSLDYYARHTSQEWVPGSKVIFLPGTHTLDVNLSFILMNTSSLILTSKNCSLVIVKCSQNSGFVFKNVNNLRIECLVFSGCGRHSEPVHCSRLFVALLFVACSNVLVENVTVEHSSGYGLCGSEISGYFHVNNSLLQYNIGNDTRHGGHMQAFYSSEFSANATLRVVTTHFENGRNEKNESTASGIAVTVLSVNSTVEISIENSLFRNNSSGGNGGHIFVVMHSLNHCLNLANNVLTGGRSHSGGAVYIGLPVRPLSALNKPNTSDFISVYNCTFLNNTSQMYGGAIYLVYHKIAFLPFPNSFKERIVNFNWCEFKHNSILNPKSPSGTALHVLFISPIEYAPRPVPQLNLIIQDCNISEGSYMESSRVLRTVPFPEYPCGQIYLIDVISAVINGSRIFNSNCSGILADHSTIIFAGSILLSNNTALRGGAMYLGVRSVFYLTPNNTKIAINNNQATYGGGIYVEQSSQCFLEEVRCFFQLSTSKINNVNITFNKNKAEVAGQDIFGGSITTCFLFISNNSKQVFQDVFSFDVKKPSYISSPPRGVCFCSQQSKICQDMHMSIYPGQKFSVEVIVVGQYNGPVPGNVVTETEAGVNLEILQYLQNVQGTSCTNISFNLFSNRNTTKLTLRANAWCKNDQLFDRYLYVDFIKCPIGFELDHDSCHCIGQSVFFCSLDNENITRISPYWVGLDGDPGKGVVVGVCPYDYCKVGEVFIKTNSDTLYHDMLCQFGRTGVLCGECPLNTSAVFGSSRCRECGNDSLFLLIPLAAGGLGLVFILIVLDITVTHGTINGLIFYVNVVQIINNQIFPPDTDNLPVLYQFISWLNLNLGFETCFYNGMDTYVKAWLQWSFPLYLFSLVMAIVLCTRKSTYIMRLVGRKATSILATLLLLSFSKVIENTVSVFVFSPLRHPNDSHWKTVWTLDGNIPYGSRKHIPLIVMGVVAILITLPYVMLLLCIQCVRRINHRYFNWVSHIKPLTDAYTGIYKDQYAFWTGHLLLIRAAICVVATFGIIQYEGMILGFIVGSCTHILILSIWLFRGVYKYWILDVLESSFVMNVFFLCATTALVRKGSFSTYQIFISYTSVGIAFVTFIGIVLYHVHLRLCSIAQYQHLIEYLWSRLHRSSDVEPLLSISRSTEE